LYGEDYEAKIIKFDILDIIGYNIYLGLLRNYATIPFYMNIKSESQFGICRGLLASGFT
jgi:hypothetical protein